VDYALLKAVHVTCVVLSGTGFLLRGALALSGAAPMQRRWVRVVPHLVDTVLLASALAMLATARLWPSQHPWLATKIALLIVYVLLGMLAFGRARTQLGQRAAYVGALLVFAWIVGVALTRSPLLGLTRSM
jgi:uncharacterized membrane protein SirB2